MKTAYTLTASSCRLLAAVTSSHRLHRTVLAASAILQVFPAALVTTATTSTTDWTLLCTTPRTRTVLPTVQLRPGQPTTADMYPLRQSIDRARSEMNSLDGHSIILMS